MAVEGGAVSRHAAIMRRLQAALLIDVAGKRPPKSRSCRSGLAPTASIARISSIVCSG
jgi:hypothetical protein